MYDELVKRLRLYTENVVAYKLGADFASAVQEAADAIEELSKLHEAQKKNLSVLTDAYMKSWIPVTEDTPSDFVSVQAHMTDAGPFPSVREAYTVDGLWFFPALKEFHPVDMWKRFDEPPKEEAE